MDCSACQSAETKILFKTRDYTGNSDRRYTLNRCRACGLVYVNPSEIPPAQNAFYPSDYRPHQKPKSTISRHKIKRLQQEVSLRFNQKKLLSPNPPYLLDLGCGAGSDLRAFRQIGWPRYNRGWQVAGVEIDRTAAEHARAEGLNVFCGTLLEAHFPDNTFDIVRLRHVLEHLPNPREVLIEIKRILKQDGLVLITTPNTHSFNFTVFGKYWYHLDTPRHLNVFNETAFKQLAHHTGFKIRAITYDSGSKGLRESIRRSKSPLLRGVRGVLQISLFKYLLAPFMMVIDILRWGDTMTIVLQKSRE